MGKIDGSGKVKYLGLGTGSRQCWRRPPEAKPDIQRLVGGRPPSFDISKFEDLIFDNEYLWQERDL
jgi:hypothetical protein